MLETQQSEFNGVTDFQYLTEGLLKSEDTATVKRLFDQMELNVQDRNRELHAQVRRTRIDLLSRIASLNAERRAELRRQPSSHGGCLDAKTNEGRKAMKASAIP